MVLLISEWYNEKNIEFNISYKILKHIRNVLEENIVKTINEGFEDYKDFYLNLVITTSKKTEKLEVKGAKIRKRQKMIDYGLWLPYKRIKKSKKHIEDFIYYLFEAFKIVFSNYNIKIIKLDNIRDDILKEVINNSEYI